MQDETTPVPRGRVRAVDVLLGDVFALIAACLTGFDLLRLSHTNRRLLRELLAPNAPLWRSRVALSYDRHVSPKAQYFASTSVRFLGRETTETTVRERGGAVEVWSKGLPAYWTNGSFSLEITFALLPSDSHGVPFTHIGGVLLGAQSVPWSTKRWAESHQQFVHVDSSGNLFCSVMDRKPVVVEQLELQRWYHLVLTFDRPDSMATSGATQHVYLNGELLHEATGSLHSEWWNLRFGQLGSGCISGASPGKPTADFYGWYGFHGVVDDCRLWRGVLPPDMIRRVSSCTEPGYSDDGDCVLEWSLQQSGCDPLGFASRVRCTRPDERICSDVHDVDDGDA